MEKNISKIAVLLTCHNRRQKTLNCLHSLFEASLPSDYEFEVFLVDDGSSDGTEIAVKQSFPSVNVIKGNGTLFWNRGMYLAWETANQKYDFDFYLWLNDDTVLFRNSLNITLKESENENHKSLIVGPTCDTTKTKTTYGGWVQNKLIPTNGEKKYCDTFNGNFVLVSKFVFNQVGNLDYRYRHTSGDFDYGYRAKKMGIKSVLTDQFIGICERDKKTLKCFDPDVPLIKRIRLFYTPIGKNPFEYFYFNKKHKGVAIASKIFFTNHIRVLFPSLFIK